MSYWKRLYIFEIMKQNHLKWWMCMDVSHNTNCENPQVISFDNDNDNDNDNGDDDDDDNDI